ncbi:MAG TPA: 2-amino-4-hydroxy-6-hydroxymethyldihydropteridine diphosphokinase [Lacipirellulaceae bacterium]|nr:2-amino-4-hydroxy-6-hydroxymethyldihydropteridine diphosphokinase [Lacipirellulaceae bacterium]
MARCLIALGANQGPRAETLRRAIAEISQLPQTQVLARSAWRQVPPVGGPAGQEPYLNGALLAETVLTPSEVLARLHAIESRLGRVRTVHWGPRLIDLDLLLVDRHVCRTPELTLPHPHMQHRGFVLGPAAEIAPHLVDPVSQWTLAALWSHLQTGANEVAVVASDPAVADSLAAYLVERLDKCPAADSMPRVVRWAAVEGVDLASHRPKLILAVIPATGIGQPEMRRMLQLPATGPVSWIAAADPETVCREACSAVQSVWPDLLSPDNA